MNLSLPVLIDLPDFDLSIFRIEGPALISFSGGRTSGVMLYLTLQAYQGTLPANVHVCFFNTGQEREETLEFVRDCGLRWNVEITWLEYDRVQDEIGEWHNTFRVVNFDTASRGGEPFSTLIASRSYLPNVVTRFCTVEMKIRVGKKFMLAAGYEHWNNAVGIRADEPKRLQTLPTIAYENEDLFGLAPKQPINNGSDSRERWTRLHPLAEAGICVEHVTSFWQAHRCGIEMNQWLAMPRNERPGWDLALRPDEGNCTLCFLKGRKKLLGLMRERPQDADWWIEQERITTSRAASPTLARFNKRHTVAEMLEQSKGGPMFADFEFDERELTDCHCTD